MKDRWVHLTCVCDAGVTEGPFDDFGIKLSPGLRAPVHKGLIGRSLLVTPPGVLNLPIPHEVPVLVLENGFERFVDVSVDAQLQYYPVLKYNTVV